MIVALAFCPHPPLLVPEVASGAAYELEELRAACDAAVGRLAAAAPDEIVVLGTGGRPGGLRQFGVDGHLGEAAGTLPLSLTIGGWLLDRAGWTGRRTLHAVGDGALDGAVSSGGPARTAVLVMADGTARRWEKGPGYLDARAEPFDAAVADALGAGSPEGLAALDSQLADELLATGCAVWKLVGGVTAGRTWDGELLYADAPYGVGYTVATWQPG